MKNIFHSESRNDRLLRVLLKLDKILLPAELEEKFRASRENPNCFWSPVTSNLDPSILKTLPPSSCFIEVYNFAKSIQEKASWTHVIWRFITLFFFDLSQLYLVQRPFAGTVNRTDELLKALQVDQCHFTSINSDLRKWIGVGETYSKLAEALGEGSLFLLPQELTNH